MLYLLFTVDGDWKEYFNVNLSEEERLPKKEILQSLIEREIEVANRVLDGKFLHFIHTSPRARTFFLDELFLGMWKRIVEAGGDIGVHCHEDDPYKEYYCTDTARMREVISQQTNTLRKNDLAVEAYRGGYLAFCPELIPVLAENGLRFDFSSEPGRYLVHNDQLVSDWRGAPTLLYEMSKEDHRKEGKSGVYEIPLGTAKGNYLYFEKANIPELELVASQLVMLSEKEGRDIIVSVLTHSYEYTSSEEIKNIEDKIAILKNYGKFINLKELSSLI